MRRWWFVVLIAALCATTARAEQALPEEIRLASEEWEGHTGADGKGMAWDILRLVFEPVGVKLTIQSVPYMRSIGLVQRGEADAWVGSYRDEVDTGVVYPHWHYDADQISVLSLRERPVPTLATLKDFRLVWMRGYEYQRYLPNLKQYQEVQRRNSILDMLNHQRADFYIDARSEIDDLLRDAGGESRYRVTDLTSLPVYLGFADNPRGRALARLYDQRMAELVSQDRFQPIFKRWQQPYPFD